MRTEDSPATAMEQAEKVMDSRIWQGWNRGKNVGEFFGHTPMIVLHDVAWDVYLLYKPGIRWEGQEPPGPTFWMH
jgi:hypothetical protein